MRSFVKQRSKVSLRQQLLYLYNISLCSAFRNRLQPILEIKSLLLIFVLVASSRGLATSVMLVHDWPLLSLSLRCASRCRFFSALRMRRAESLSREWASSEPASSVTQRLTCQQQLVHSPAPRPPPIGKFTFGCTHVPKFWGDAPFKILILL